MLQLLDSKSDQQYVSSLVDPFKKESIDNVFIHIRKDWNKKVHFSASVEFKNGPTSGEHHFKADDFASLVKQVDDFIKHL